MTDRCRTDRRKSLPGLIKWLPEWRIFVRVGGRTRYFTLSSRSRALLLGAYAVLGLWSLFATLAYFDTRAAVESGQRALLVAIDRKQQSLEQVWNLYRAAAQEGERVTSLERIVLSKDEELAGRQAEIAALRHRLQETLASVDARVREALLAKEAELGRLRQRHQAALDDTKAAVRRAVAAKEGELGEMRRLYRATFGTLFDYDRLFTRTADEIERLQASLGVIAGSPAGTAQAWPPTGCKVPKKARPPSGEAWAGEAELQPALLESPGVSQGVGRLEAALERLKSSHAGFLRYYNGLANGRLDDLRDGLSRVGFDLEEMMPPDHAAFGSGGPFIAPNQQGYGEWYLALNLLTTNLARWENIYRVTRDLPIGLPLRSYRITSSFGSRRDPINERTGHHEGIDLGAPYHTPVLATGSGTVKAAGGRGRYGRVVEIDHGNGFTTLYAHLGCVVAKRGQQVGRGELIGLVGSSGRSTGPHLHYEVRIDGKPQNPIKFMAVGANVFKGK